MNISLFGVSAGVKFEHCNEIGVFSNLANTLFDGNIKFTESLMEGTRKILHLSQLL